MPKLNWKLLTKKRGSSTQGLPPGKDEGDLRALDKGSDLRRKPV